MGECQGTCDKKCGEHNVRWDTEIPELRRDIEEINTTISSTREETEKRRVEVDDKNNTLSNRCTSIEKAHNIFMGLIVALFIFSGLGYLEASLVGKSLQEHKTDDTKEFGSLGSHLSYHASRINEENKQETEIEKLKESYTEVKVHFNIILDRLNSIERKM